MRKKDNLLLPKSKLLNKAINYIQKNALTIEDVYEKEKYIVYKGEVACNYGFAHHPIIALDKEESNVLTSSTCDCYESNEGDLVCSHCLALAYKMNYNRVPIIKKSADIQMEIMATGKVYDFELFDIKEDTNEIGQRRIHGTALCNFGFVHFPEIVLEGNVLYSSYCDCYLYENDEEMCPHCKALYSKALSSHSEEIKKNDEPEKSEETNTKERVCFHDPETMKILFGKDVDTNEEIEWKPNDTHQLLHTNTGIIGTMGTGKTQFTKSFIAQMIEQKEHNYTGCPLGILIFDYKGDYNEHDNDFIKATKAKVLKANHLPYNPLALDKLKEKASLPMHTASAFVGIISQLSGRLGAGGSLGPIQKKTLTDCVLKTYEKCGITNDNNTWKRMPPTFDMVYDIYKADPQIKKNDSLCYVMDYIHGFEIFEPSPQNAQSLFDLIDGVVVIDISDYDSAMQSLIVSMTLEVFYSQMKNAGPSGKDEQYRELRKVICVDEADAIMSEGFSALKNILKEGREFGVGVVLSTQFLKHFNSYKDDYSSYISTWVVHNVPDLNKHDLEFLFDSDEVGLGTNKLLIAIKNLERMHSIVKIGNQGFKHIEDKAFYRYLEEKNKLSEEIDKILPNKDLDEDILEDDEKPSIQNLTYGFCNTQRDLYPGIQNPVIPLERYEMMFGKGPLSQAIYNRYGKWRGSCYGFSTSAALFYTQGNGVSITDYKRFARYPSELNPTDKNKLLSISLLMFIEAMQISQCGAKISRAKEEVFRKPLDEKLRDICEKVESFEKYGEHPIILSVFRKGYRGGHAVLPYGYKRLDEKNSRLSIYDPNHPGSERYCDIEQDDEGKYINWRFRMNSKEEYSSQNGGEIGYTINEVNEEVWKESSETQGKVVCNTENSDITILDDSGESIVNIDAGEFSVYRDDVVRIIVTDNDVDDEDDENNYSFWMNSGKYRIINKDNSKLLNFEMADNRGSVEISTESNEIEIELDEKKNIQKVKILQGEKPFSVRIKNTLKEIFIKGITSVAGTLIANIAGKILLQYIPIANIFQFLVNGEEEAAENYIENNEENKNTTDNKNKNVQQDLLVVNKKEDDTTE